MQSIFVCVWAATQVNRALAMEAVDDQAAAFCAKYEFLPSPSDPRHLASALETVAKVLGGPK
jgi:hypothetical protein